MPIPWKYVGLAGLAGVAATGAVVARRRRAQREDIGPDELRQRLHERLADVTERRSHTSGTRSPGPSGA